jgi:hypothetical protein
VAAGQAHTLFLVDPASLDLDKLDSWECETAAEEAAAPSADAAKGGTLCTLSGMAVDGVSPSASRSTVTPSHIVGKAARQFHLEGFTVYCCHAAGSKRKGAAAGGGAKKGRKK